MTFPQTVVRLVKMMKVGLDGGQSFGRENHLLLNLLIYY